jgi:hypothetical protein
MDLEIEQAVYAGLDYWAFVAYPRESPMSVALRQYLDSSAHRRIRFCMFTQFEYWGTARQPTAMIDEHIALMLNDAYVRVEQGRPLYFLGFVTESKVIERWGSLRGLRAQIDRFRARAVATGAGNPYIVLGGSPRDGKGWAPALGGDAIGAYTIAEGRAVGDFAALTRVAEAGWQTMAGSGLTVVPTVMAGWDRRPRVENPVPWEKSQRPGAGIEYHFTAPTPQELMVHLRQALDWVRSQPTGRQAPAVLIYAWNENDEGGWLVPTVPCDQRRLQALHGVLAHGMQIPQPGCSIVR